MRARPSADGVDEIGITEHMYYFRRTEALLGTPSTGRALVHDIDGLRGAIVEAKERGWPVKLGLELEHVGDRDGRARQTARAVPVGLPPRLGAPTSGDGRRLQPDLGAWTEHSGRRRLAPLLRGARRSRRERARRRARPPRSRRRSSAAGRRRGRRRVPRGAATAIAEADVAVEVSTAGLRKPVGELYPDAGFLTRCRERGVGGHARLGRARRRRTSGRDFDAGLAHLRAAGYETVTVFEGRGRAPGAARMSDLRVGIGVDAHAFADGAPLVARRRRDRPAARPRGPLRRRRARARPRRRRCSAPPGSATSARSSRRREPRWRARRRWRCSSGRTAAVREAGFELVNADCRPDRRGAAARAAPARDARAGSQARSVSTRRRSPCVRRRPTASASPAAARGSPRRRSRSLERVASRQRGRRRSTTRTSPSRSSDGDRLGVELGGARGAVGDARAACGRGAAGTSLRSGPCLRAGS